jgi:hypothetical protein
VLFSTLPLACGLAGYAARAHAAPVEPFQQLALNPNAPDVMLLRYEDDGDGVLHTHDGGKTWSLSCSSAVDRAAVNFSAVAVAGDGTAIIGGFIDSADDAWTVWEGDVLGCGYARVDGPSDVWITDVQVDPTDRDVLYAVSGGFREGERNGLWKRAADGAWSAIGPRERVMIMRLRLAKTAHGVRMYQSGLRQDGADLGYVIRVSDDGGETWDERPYAAPEHTSFELEAIDPRDPDTIVASLGNPEASGFPADETKDRLLVSRDRGATFSEYLMLSEVGGVVFDAEARLWIGEAGSPFDGHATRGLWSSQSLEDAPRKVGDEAVLCLAFQPATDTLYACQPSSLAVVDRANDAALRTIMEAASVASLTTCDGQDAAAACEDVLCSGYCGAGHFAQAPACAAYSTPACGPAAALRGGDAARDRGARADAATDAEDVRLTGTDGDCGCRVAGRAREHGAGIAWLFAALVLAGRQVRRPRRG